MVSPAPSTSHAIALAPDTAATVGEVDQQLGAWSEGSDGLARPADRRERVAEKVCFAAGTPLLTPHGSTPIEQFRPSDCLPSSPEGDLHSSMDPQQLEELFIHTTWLWHLHVGGQMIHTKPPRFGPQKEETMLRRFWFEFALTMADAPPLGTLLGCGVTAGSKEEAINLLKERVFTAKPLPRIKRCIEDVDLASLDQNHVLPNMSAPDQPGVWFPLGYDE